MQIESNLLDGQALIWATCSALGHSPEIAMNGIAYRSDHGSWVYPRYTDDTEAGDLIASYWISVERPSKGQQTPSWRVVTDSRRKVASYEFNGPVVAHGPTLGIAVCRVLVIAHFGQKVEIPDVLRSAVCV